ncbi:DegT/DnrJ/EryC1/StrS family aminotransferase [Plantactinospora sp. B6F1]|uniref:DegT/DnrJ/EryC1/StrS family aminotransferase n=1 Tax=Plantactinospora sp. B6F1 TaxID=3158971 RepID=UPI0032D99895
MSRLAMLGGEPAVPAGTPAPEWPVVTNAERAAVAEVLRSGRFTGVAAGEQEIPALEREWAGRVGTAHCLAVANGTVALSLALCAAGVAAGDEVIVPALSFVGSALAVAHLGAVPVFADIDPVTFNLAPHALAAARSARTAAVLPVHLHGLPAEMDEICAFARRHGLAVVEDAAQSHGVAYRGRVTGSIGTLGAFSLNASKNLPTCGEGGLVTTDDDELAAQVGRMRQFGEDIPARGERPYLSRSIGWNAKLGAIQAAFTRRQLARLDEASRARDRAVRPFLDRVAALPGFTVPVCPEDREHGWHILRFRVRAEAFGLPGEYAPALRPAATRVLRGEGVPVSRYQSVPLPEQPVFRDGGVAHRATDVSVCRAVVDDSFVIQRAQLNPGTGALLRRFADAFEKLWANRDVLVAMARSSRTDAPVPSLAHTDPLGH